MSAGDLVCALAAAASRSGSLSPATLDRVRLHALDSLGAMYAGALTQEGRATRAPVLRLAGEGAFPGCGAAAAILAASCRLTECDDIHLASCTTPGSIVSAVALAMTQVAPVDAGTAAQAVVAGYEVMAALGTAADGPRIVYGEAWPTYLAAAMTAAAVAAKLLKLPEEGIATAIAIAATMTSGASGRIAQDPTSRWLTLGCAVANGLTAAAGAQAGLRGDLGILDRSQVFAPARLLAATSSSRPAIEEAALKPYCTGRQSLAATEAFIALLSEESVDPRAIERIRVTVPAQYRAMIDRSGRPTTKMESRGIRYQLALAAFRPDDLFDIDRPILRTSDPDMCRLMDQVEVGCSDSFAAMYPQAWPGGVEVMARGRTWERSVVHPRGDPECPLTWRDVEFKLQSMARRAGAAIPLEALGAAARALDFAPAMALLSAPELWRIDPVMNERGAH